MTEFTIKLWAVRICGEGMGGAVECDGADYVINQSGDDPNHFEKSGLINA